MTVWTIGHSTRTAEEFVAVLAAHEIETVVDVRRFPGSRRLPQFGSAALERSLRDAGVAYRWIEALGGRRRPDPESPNDAWENEAFRGYADHTETEEFAEGLFELLMIASGLPTAVMCAELLWWRCHRRIIADVLASLGHEVRHIRDDGADDLHELAPPARMVDGVLTYASPVVQLDLYPEPWIPGLRSPSPRRSVTGRFRRTADETTFARQTTNTSHPQLRRGLMTTEASAPDTAAAALDPLDTRSMLISLTAKDLSKSVAWYRDVLGFTVDNVRERDGKPAAASVRSGTAKIFLNQDDGGRGWERVKGEGFAITFDTAQDVDAIAARIKAKGWTLAMEPADMPWGVRMLRVLDPDGYRLNIWRPLSV